MPTFPTKKDYEYMGIINGFHVRYFKESETYELVEVDGDIELSINYDQIIELTLLMGKLVRDAAHKSLHHG